MKLLKNFDSFKEYLDLDSKEFYFFDKLHEVTGIYKIVKGTMTGLLVDDKKLYFLSGSDEILITEHHTVLLRQQNNTENEFMLLDRDEIVVKFLDSLPESNFNVSPFEYIDEEDFEWGEFLEKIINDNERKEAFISNLSGGST